MVALLLLLPQVAGELASWFQYTMVEPLLYTTAEHPAGSWELLTVWYWLTRSNPTCGRRYTVFTTVARSLVDPLLKKVSPFSAKFPLSNFGSK